MSLPPDDDSRDAELSSIQEPPPDRENDTRPLRAVKPSRAGESSSPAGDSLPAATVLENPGRARRLSKKPTTRHGDTDRVRILPQLKNPPAWRVIFQVGNPIVTTVGLDVRKALVIGRADAESDELPDLDLTAHRAFHNGISRQHAALIPTSDGLFLSDLGSINGTWINGAYLDPGERCPLSTGDVIELGLLRLIVRSVSLIARSTT